MIGTTAKPTRELPNQLTGMFSIPVSANPTKLMLVVLGAFESSLGSRKMPPIFTPCVKIVLSGLISAGLPCSWIDVEIRCRVTRQLVVSESFEGHKFITQWTSATFRLIVIGCFWRSLGLHYCEASSYKWGLQ